MTISRRTAYLSILLLIALNLLYRYPFTPHEWGVDSFIMHRIALSIVTYGRAKWILSPFSYLGMYPLSTPSGMEFFISTLSMMSGVSMEGVIYFTGLLFAIAGCLGTFLLAYDVKRDHFFALLSALLFTTAPYFVATTTWTMSTRPYMVSLVPVFILFLVRYHRTGKALWFVSAGISLIFLLSLHRLAFLLVFVIAAYMLSGILLKALRRTDMHYRMSPKRKAITYMALVSSYALAVMYVQYQHPYGGLSLSLAYSEGALFNGHSLTVILLNILANFTGKVGILFPLGIVAVFLYYKIPLKEHGDYILLLSIISSLLFLVTRTYISIFIISIFSFFIAAPLVFFILKNRHIRRRLAISLVFLLLISSLFFSAGMRNHWVQLSNCGGIVGGKRYMTGYTYSTGTYIRYNSNGNIIGNEALTASRLGTVTGTFIEPEGRVRPLELLTHDIEKPSDISVHPIDLTRVSFGTDYLFTENEALNAQTAWYRVMTTDSPVIQAAYYNYYNFSYVAEDRIYEGELYQSYSVNPQASHFLNEMHRENYIIYSNQKLNLWRYTP